VNWRLGNERTRLKPASLRIISRTLRGYRARCSCFREIHEVRVRRASQESGSGVLIKIVPPPRQDLSASGEDGLVCGEGFKRIIHQDLVEVIGGGAGI